MKNRGDRAGRRTLVSACWLLLFAGLSCKYNVTLPWVPEDAKALEPDISSFDQASAPSPDAPPADPDARGCPVNLQSLDLQRHPAQILVAIDRSLSMQKGGFDSTSKLQAVLSALNASAAKHTQVSHSSIWFPGNNCGPSACCASRAGSPDASASCGATDGGCLPSSNDSPSHRALEQARAYMKDSWARNTLVLITDQDPKCASEPSSDQALCDSAINAVSAIVSSEVRTFVIVPTTDSRPPSCLAKIASLNRDPDAQKPKLAKNSRDVLDQLDRIASGIDLCTFYPPFWADPGQIEQVKIAGETIQRDESGTNGWRQDGRAIVLSSAECTRIKDTPNLEAKAYSCSSGRWPNGN